MDEAKKDAGYRAADLVRDGMVIGLGTGSTVLYAMESIASRMCDEDLRIAGVPTSYEAAYRAVGLGIPLTTLDEHPVLDLAIDGADQVDPGKRMIKGRGAALLREKCVADAADQFVVIIDESKCVKKLHGQVPIEVLSFAQGSVVRQITDLGAQAAVRSGSGKDGPVVSDNGHLIMDCQFGALASPDDLELRLAVIPGLLESGLFTRYTGKTRVIIGGK
ncbi:MAG: ribose-5-phosphate isomerase RpiA [Methanocalculus sp. MSAO_Arc1]|uniref:ribose-5-phosphate isomerase RpiA n=1 Tax=Methanocalculus TaxID=71151 RepID=UPI000FF0338E|nr:MULTISPECIES: ribose-5-phosphate isomerase RpiA [unclassified Methanocalculus]MCP1662535.1 ribose 5-phosphate isomerase A [Methanocalculus sp. AMF5]RQD80094.1 MAG: ribose-5-phosphate isomerase RpiA [Methanocalculus sp. MSAO_Arc1]